MSHHARTFFIVTGLATTLVLGAADAVVPTSGLAARYDCSQPVTNGPVPTASDCLFILKVAVDAEVCTPECICAPKGSLPTTAADALLCLRFAVGQDVEITCPCDPGTTTLPPPTTTLSQSTTTTISSATTSTLPSVTTTTIPVTTTTLGGGPYSCTIDTAECTTTSCSCGTDPGVDYHTGASSGTVHGPIGTQLRVNINAIQGGVLDCGGWTRIFGNVLTGCDVIGCCQREGADPESTDWSVFEVIDLPCFCPSNPFAGEFKPNILIQCQLPPQPVIEVERAATGCP